MDGELLLALCVLWFSSTIALVSCLLMWFFNEGESFHPHSVDIDHRHALFVVVHGNTCCKMDCCVKSISEFIAPRGSSSSKQFTVLCAMISVAGFLGSFRWFKVGDGQLIETILSLSGFASLLLVAAFELNVAPERYLEDKLLVTGWLIQKLRLDHKLPFSIDDTRSLEFIRFIRSSKGIYHLYDEDVLIQERSADFKVWAKPDLVWLSMHMIGATGYVVLITAAILLNDLNEHPVAWITGACFVLFSSLGYFTGHYVPVFRCFRCWILLWNPFYKEPHFMLRLQQAVEDYARRENNEVDLQVVETFSSAAEAQSSNPTVSGARTSRSRRRRASKHKKHHNEMPPQTALSMNVLRAVDVKDESTAAREADKALDNFSLRFARNHPRTYLKVVGHLMVMSELIALLTPAVAMGIQWVTALCDGPPVPALLSLFSLGFQCIGLGNCQSIEESWKNCILKERH